MAPDDTKADFKPALVIVDVQEDFCPPVSLTPRQTPSQH